MPSDGLLAKLREVEEWRQKNKLLEYELEITRTDVEAKQKATREMQQRAAEMRAQNAAIHESVEKLQASAEESPASAVLFAVLEQKQAAAHEAMLARLKTLTEHVEQTEEIREKFEAEKARCDWLQGYEEIEKEHQKANEELAELKAELEKTTAACEEAEQILKEREPLELNSWILKMARETVETKVLRQRLAKLLVLTNTLKADKKQDDSLDVEMEQLERAGGDAGKAAKPAEAEPAAEPTPSDEQEVEEEDVEQDLNAPILTRPPVPSTPNPAEKAAKKRAEEPPKAREEPPKKVRAEAPPPPPARPSVHFEPVTQRIDDLVASEVAEDTPLTEEQAPETDSNIINIVIDGDEDEEEDGRVTPNNMFAFDQGNDNSPTNESPFDFFGAKRTPADARSPPNGTPNGPLRSPRAPVSDDEPPLGSIDLDVSHQESSFNFEHGGGGLDFDMGFGGSGGGGDGNGSMNFDFGGSDSPRDNTTGAVQLRELGRGQRGGRRQRQQRGIPLLSAEKTPFDRSIF
ncbi:hypothetical protein M3Y99_00870800 [Aphelenchoides fujianensis]|nr:hypothetical protein M3Y99_00870800 [Aphelenchoides fujianensis]